MRPVHSAKLERYLGAECVANLSQTMRGWYGPPIPLAGVPGRVYAAGDGDFCGRIDGGGFVGAVERNFDRIKLVARTGGRIAARAARKWLEAQRETAHTGFSSLSDLISEATTGGKAQDLTFTKAATTATTVGTAFVARNVGTFPAARGTGGTSGTGVKTTSATTGALKFANPSGSDTLHLTTATVQASAVSSLMLFDCLWDMTYNHASSTSTAVDSANRPDRYQGTTTAPGNFVSSEITTALSATAHTITVTYVDDAGNTAEAATAYSAAVSAVAGRCNTPAGTWFVTLNSGDRGARYLTNIAQSTTASVTGVSTFFVGHPLALFPCPTANVPFIYDGINSAFSLVEILTDANLSFMTPGIATTGSITYNGILRVVSG